MSKKQNTNCLICWKEKLISQQPCPHCWKDDTKHQIFVWILVLIWIIAFLWWIFFSGPLNNTSTNNSKNTIKKSDYMVESCTASQFKIEEKLRDPKSAKHPRCSEWIYLEWNEYHTFQSYVDSKNW